MNMPNPPHDRPPTWAPAPLSSRWMERQAGMSESELLIRTLYEITSDYRRSFDDQLTRLLDLGCRRFDMEIGVASSIRGDAWRIRQLVAPVRYGLEVGQRFSLERTLCGLTTRAGGALGFEDLRHSSVADHPAVAEGALAAYIGVPVRMGERVWGTLAFLSLESRERSFTQADVDSLQLMASWVATEAQRRMAEEALRDAKRLLEHASRTDPLTGLLNRRALEAELEVRHAANTDLVAILVDADDFKAVNTDFGHAGGDRVLQAIASRTAATVRETDVFGRIGGDEFLVLVPDRPLDAAVRLAERIRLAVTASPADTPKGPCTPKVSLGVVPVDANAHTVTDILKRASAVLAECKEKGKNQVCVAGPL